MNYDFQGRSSENFYLGDFKHHPSIKSRMECKRVEYIPASREGSALEAPHTKPVGTVRRVSRVDVRGVEVEVGGASARRTG